MSLARVGQGTVFTSNTVTGGTGDGTAAQPQPFPSWEPECFSDGEGHMRESAAGRFTRLLAQKLQAP